MERKSLLDFLWTDRNNDGMTSIITASAPGADVNVGRENIYKFAFAFVSPLSTKNDGS